MARMDRCSICDYTELNGSGYAGVNPGRHGRVRMYDDYPRCDTCAEAIRQASIDLLKPEQVDEDLEILED